MGILPELIDASEPRGEARGSQRVMRDGRKSEILTIATSQTRDRSGMPPGHPLREGNRSWESPGNGKTPP